MKFKFEKVEHGGISINSNLTTVTKLKKNVDTKIRTDLRTKVQYH